MHPISQIVEHRLTGALETLEKITAGQISGQQIIEKPNSPARDFRERLGDQLFSEGTPTAKKSLQQEIGERQVFASLNQPGVTVASLQHTYQRDLDTLQRAPHASPIRNSMWDETDRAIYPFERGYSLIGLPSPVARQLENVAQGAPVLAATPSPPSTGACSTTATPTYRRVRARVRARAATSSSSEASEASEMAPALSDSGASEFVTPPPAGRDSEATDYSSDSGIREVGRRHLNSPDRVANNAATNQQNHNHQPVVAVPTGSPTYVVRIRRLPDQGGLVPRRLFQ